jgi:hypothetical protein
LFVEQKLHIDDEGRSGVILWFKKINILCGGRSEIFVMVAETEAEVLEFPLSHQYNKRLVDMMRSGF